jgi:hypothetical protein
MMQTAPSQSPSGAVNQDAAAAPETPGTNQDAVENTKAADTTIVQAIMPAEIIRRGLPTMAHPLVTAMGNDARAHADVIATDATGVFVQANERCKKGCFTVYVSNNGHVIFRYSKRNSSDEPNEFLTGFKGTVLADATATLDAICKLPDVYRAGCHSHYLESDVIWCAANVGVTVSMYAQLSRAHTQDNAA